MVDNILEVDLLTTNFEVYEHQAFCIEVSDDIVDSPRIEPYLYL